MLAHERYLFVLPGSGTWTWRLYFYNIITLLRNVIGDTYAFFSSVYFLTFVFIACLRINVVKILTFCSWRLVFVICGATSSQSSEWKRRTHHLFIDYFVFSCLLFLLLRNAQFTPSGTLTAIPSIAIYFYFLLFAAKSFVRFAWTLNTIRC